MICFLFFFLASSDLQVFSGAQGPAGAMVNQTVTPASLTQPAQVGSITKLSLDGGYCVLCAGSPMISHHSILNFIAIVFKCVHFKYFVSF